MKLKLLIIALLFGITVKAQNTPNITPSHLKAADELLKISGADSLFKSSMQLSLKQSSANIPADKREKFMEVMNSFFAKYISWDLLKDQLAAIYAAEFTEQELKQITAFYRTPLGKKLNAKQPVIMQRSMVLGQQMVQSHQVELQQMLQDAFKEQQ
ncbi:hypothetical protein CKK33_04650 [Mucilaginibacter sp. MD40]|uniref:DUF2059 domain-containing protein n=2 Tax=Mucilaginibacter TaxID=423349 RepID=UPI000BAC57E6|nr:DUF2059 domain-containing protein [Mucilaginibacter sp. MD40]PAW92821.1 hypothetical protein CKK33_04650 [Mucilaginibacter sp. MD40]